MVKGTETQARALLEQLAERAAAVGLKLKAAKTGITHIDAGFVFLGQRIIRRAKGHKRHVYTFVCDEALASIKRRIKSLAGRSTTYLELVDLLRLSTRSCAAGPATSATPRPNAPSPTSATTRGGE